MPSKARYAALFNLRLYHSPCKVRKVQRCAEFLTREDVVGKENDPMARPMCTKNCVKMGEKYVLFDAAKKTTYELDDQEKPVDFAGQKVKVKGSYDKATKTIHVTSIEAAS